MSPSGPAYTGPYQAISPSAGGTSSISKEHSYPQRPGQPECQHYLKTGDCKFGSSCKYNHPSEWVVPETSSALSPMGLPLRPVCTLSPHTPKSHYLLGFFLYILIGFFGYLVSLCPLLFILLWFYTSPRVDYFFTCRKGKHLDLLPLYSVIRLDFPNFCFRVHRRVYVEVVGVYLWPIWLPLMTSTNIFMYP